MQLTIGQTFKSYKALCQHLKEEVKTGEAKQNQLKNWEIYFAFEKQGNSLKITQVFKPFPESFSKLSSNKSLIPPREAKKRTGFWQENLISLVILFFNERLNSEVGKLTVNEINFTSLEAMIAFGFCNENMKQLKNKEKTLSDFLAESEVTPSFLDLIDTSSPIIVSSEPSEPSKIKVDVSTFLSDFQEKHLKDCNQIFSRCFKLLAREKIITYAYTYGVMDSESFTLRRSTPAEEHTIRTIHEELYREFLPLSVIENVPETALEEESDPISIGKRDSYLLRKVKYLADEQAFFKKRAIRLKAQGIFGCKKAHFILYSPLSLSFFPKHEKALTEAYLLDKINERAYNNLIAYYLKHPPKDFIADAVRKVADFSIKLPKTEEA